VTFVWRSGKTCRKLPGFILSLSKQIFFIRTPDHQATTTEVLVGHWPAIEVDIYSYFR
jgi:hypothetical protein